MSWIVNCSRAAVKYGDHFHEPGKTWLIQISDCDNYPGAKFVEPQLEFGQVLQLRFDDTENESHPNAMNQHEAEMIAEFLKSALEQNQNVVVHCVAGICRSGAVVEVGIMLGFMDRFVHRIPNQLVKQKLRRELNILHSWEKT